MTPNGELREVDSEMLCATCVFIDKCHVFKFIHNAIDAIETEAFQMMRVNLELEPKITICREYIRDPLMDNEDEEEDGV